jgi:hypothetical protein
MNANGNPALEHRRNIGPMSLFTTTPRSSTQVN